MMASKSDALRPEFGADLRLELPLAIAAVTLITLAVTQPGFLVAALCAGLALTALLNFDLFVCLIVFFLPWNPFINWRFPVHDVFLLAHFLVFAVVWVFQVRRGVSLKQWLWAGWTRKGVWFFAAIATISLLISDYRLVVDSYQLLAKHFSYIATFFAISGWAHSRQRIARILKILVVSTIGVCLFGLYQALEGSFTGLYFLLYPSMEEVFDAQGGWHGRITSFLFHYNSLAGYLNTVGPLALAVAVLGKEQWLRVTGFVCLVFIGAAQYLTGSRGGLAGYGAFGFIAICCLKPRRKTIAVLLIASILAAVLGPTLAYLGDLQSDRLKDVDDFTLESRVALWGAAGIIFLQHPLMGAGFGTYRFRFHQYVPGIIDNLDAHDIYLQFLAEIGIAGFLVFFTTLWCLFRCGIRLVRTGDALWQIVGIGAAGAIPAMMAHGLVDYIFNVSPQFGNLFWLVLALALSACEQLPMQQKSDEVVSEGSTDGRRGTQGSV